MRHAWILLILGSGCRLILGIEDLPGGGDGGVGDIAPGSLSISPSYVDFGAGLTGMAPGASFTFTVTNLSTTVTPLLVTMASGHMASEFTVTGSTCTGITLSPQATCTVDVAFAPTQAASSDAAVLVSGGGAGGVEAQLYGEGVKAGTLAVSPTSRDFGAAVIDSATGAVQFTVTDPTATVGSGAITTRILGNDRQSFALTFDDCTDLSINADGICTLGVQFVGINAGAARAVLEVSSPVGGAAVVPLIGVGVVAKQIAVTPAMLSFTSTVATPSAEQTLMVNNTGTSTIGPIRPTTPDPQFVISSNGCTAGLTAGASCSVKVKFIPSVVASSTAAPLLLTSADATAVVSLQGASTPGPRLEVEFATITVPQAMVAGAPTRVPVRLWNSGDQPITAISVTSSNTTEFSWTPGSCSNLAAGQSCSGQVAFQPGAAGARTTTLTITAMPGGAKTIDITGTGVTSGALTVLPNAPLNFADTNLGSRGSSPQSVHNNSAAPSGPITASIVDDPAFAISSDACNGVAIPASGNCSFNIDFKPSTVGFHSATLIITDGVSTVVRALTGYGSLSLRISSSTGSGAFLVMPSVCTGSSCLSTFSTTFSKLSLIPVSTASVQFSGWSSFGCTGTGPCDAALTSATTNIVLPFTTMNSVTVAKSGMGKVLVTSNLGGMVCGPLCTINVPATRNTTVTAIGLDGIVAAWSGCTAHGSTCDAPAGAVVNLTTAAASSYAYAGMAGGDDRGNGVTISPTGLIYATGAEFRATNDTDLWVMEIAADGTIRSARNNMLDVDEGIDVVVRASSGRVYTVGQQGAGGGNTLPWMVDWTFPVTGDPMPSSVDNEAADPALRYTRIVENSWGGLYALASTADAHSVFRRWGTYDLATGSHTDPRSWAAMAPGDADNVYAVGTSNGDIVIGRVNSSVSFDFIQTRATPVNETAVDVAVTPSGTLMILAQEDVEGRGSNVRIVEMSVDGTTEVRTASYDSGPDSVDVGISLTVDAAGQILVLGSTNGSPWIRKYGPALEFYWMHAVTGVNPVARRIVADAQGNIVLVGDEQAGSQRDAFVRKVGP